MTRLKATIQIADRDGLDGRRRIRTPFDFEIQREINLQPSNTVPDQTMSIAEIMKRYATGQPLTSGREGIYVEENDLLDTDLQRMDLVDREELLNKTKDYIAETQTKLQTKKSKSDEKENPPATGDTLPV